MQSVECEVQSVTCKDAEDDAANGIVPVLLLTVSSGGGGVEPTSKRF